MTEKKEKTKKMNKKKKKIIYLNSNSNLKNLNRFKEITELISTNKITHGVFVYRTIDKVLNIEIIGDQNHTTYLQGLLMRAMFKLNEKE